MKTKKVFSLALICMLLASIMFGGTDVSAKPSRSLKVTYKGKTVTLEKTSGSDKRGRNKDITVAKCEKAWGKAKKSTTENIVFYLWKNKKTRIEFSDYDAPAGAVGAMDIEIRDKNGAFAGIKVGMSKAKAVKKMRKVFGSRNVKVTSKSIYTTNGELTTAASVTIKNGKVSRISALRT